MGKKTFSTVFMAIMCLSSAYGANCPQFTKENSQQVHREILLENGQYLMDGQLFQGGDFRKGVGSPERTPNAGNFPPVNKGGFIKFSGESGGKCWYRYSSSLFSKMIPAKEPLDPSICPKDRVCFSLMPQNASSSQAGSGALKPSMNPIQSAPQKQMQNMAPQQPMLTPEQQDQKRIQEGLAKLEQLEQQKKAALREQQQFQQKYGNY